MKFLAFSDLHIHNYKSHDRDGSRLLNCLDCLELIVAYASKKGIGVVIFTGDLFDSQKHLPIEVINATVYRLKGLFQEYPDVDIMATSGNHDYANQKLLNKHVHTSLEFLHTMFSPRFNLMDEKSLNMPKDHIELHGAPYFEYPEHLYEYLNAVKLNPDGANILMTHSTAMGYENIPGNVDPKHDAFKRFDLVLSGDIHRKGWLADNFLMLGSPIHRDAGDLGDDKGFWVFDTMDLMNPKFISLNSKFPIFIEKIEGDKLTAEEKENYVVWRPAFVPDAEGTGQGNQAFHATSSAVDLVTNFFKEVGGDDQDLLNVGINLVR